MANNSAVALDAAVNKLKAELAKHNPEDDDWTLQLKTARYLRTRYNHTGPIELLEKAIQLCIMLRSEAHDNMDSVMMELANAMHLRYRRYRNTADLTQAVTLLQQALQLRPPDHPEHVTTLHNLAISLSDQYFENGNMPDLNQSIALYHQALKLCPHGHSSHDLLLDSLGCSIYHLYEQTGDAVELEKAILYHKESLHLRPLGHSNRSSSLHNLANAMYAQYMQNSNTADLDNVILLREQALQLCPLGHINHRTSLINLANGMCVRYEQNGNTADLNQAIALFENALQLNLGDQGFILSNLGIAIRHRYIQDKNKADIDQAVKLHEQVLQLYPFGHSKHISSLNNLANDLTTRYEHNNNTTDLDEGIHLLEQVLSLAATNHQDYSALLMNLAGAIYGRYKHSNNIEDLDKAISLHEQALKLCPPGHAFHGALLNNLAKIAYARHRELDDNQAWSQYMQLYRTSSNSFKCNASDRLLIAAKWAYYAGISNDISTLEAYQTALTTMETVLFIAPTFAAQHDTLKKYNYLGVCGVSYATKNGQGQTALKLLEQSRALLWSQVNVFKVHATSFNTKDNLIQRYLELAETSKSMAFDSYENTSLNNFHDHTGNMYRKKAEVERRKQSLIEQIRLQPGYESFMKLPSFDILQTVASEGPVIVVNCSAYSCDVIIICDSGAVTLLLKPEAHTEIQSISDELLTQRKHIEETPERYSLFLAESMQKLWETLVGPIVDELEKLNVPQQSHIWWCPTSFASNIPIHAAGPKPGLKKKQHFCDLYVSSYTPTLTALINARSNQVQTQVKSGPLSLLAIAQKDESLHCTDEEVSVLQNLPGVSFSSLSDADATTDRVTERLADCSWVHFACHGELKDREPFNAAFILHGDERLTLVDIIKANMPKAQFAFLSACHTAELTEGSASEEVLHLAAAMHFCGFPSVVGTLWQMNDADGPNLAQEFYKHMLAEPTEKAPEVGLRRAARSLNLATRALRKKHKVGIERWANFVHIGL